MTDEQYRQDLIKHLTDQYGQDFGPAQQAELLKSLSSFSQSTGAVAIGSVDSNTCSIGLGALTVDPNKLYTGKGDGSLFGGSTWQSSIPGTLSYNNLDELFATGFCRWAVGETYFSATFFSGWTAVGTFTGDPQWGAAGFGSANGSWTPTNAELPIT